MQREEERAGRMDGKSAQQGGGGGRRPGKVRVGSEEGGHMNGGAQVDNLDAQRGQKVGVRGKLVRKEHDVIRGNIQMREPKTMLQARERRAYRVNERAERPLWNRKSVIKKMLREIKMKKLQIIMEERKHQIIVPRSIGVIF